MVQFVYVDETGSVGRGSSKIPFVRVLAVIVEEEQVAPLAASMRTVALEHLGFYPNDFEWHGVEVWHGAGHWRGRTPEQLIAAYEAAVNLIDAHEVRVAHATINKQELHDKYAGSADGNTYVLGLQFLLEKIDRLSGLKIVIADEMKEQRLRAIGMLANMVEWGAGEVPGRPLTRIIDSLHFVESKHSPGVQLADLCAFASQRAQLRRDTHPAAAAAIGRIASKIGERTTTWRQPWP